VRALALGMALMLAGCATPRGAGEARRYYDERLAGRAVPLLEEAIRFPTVQGNTAARDAQQAWLMKTAAGLGFSARDTGKIVEVELPGPAGAPVLGLVVHGDVQPAEVKAWSIPPFAGASMDGNVLGRGAADDKGPLVHALLAMKALEKAGPARTHTIRLLVGSDEESDNTDMKEYLAAHRPPDYSLVLDYVFPVVVGEMAWTGLFLDAVPGARSNAELPFRILKLDAGLAPSIVPDRALLTLQWIRGLPSWDSLIERLRARPLPEGTRLEFVRALGDEAHLTVVAHGKSAHGGVNIERGRNALVALARATEGLLPASGENDLLAFARRETPERRRVGLNEVIELTLNLQAPQLELNKIRVVTTLEPGLTIWADPHQLQQVFLNLFSNAIHSMTTAHGHGILTVRSLRRGSEVVVEVEEVSDCSHCAQRIFEGLVPVDIARM